ncbi:hypothetical protein HQ545_05290 [Candidatus Woesearchaeota archaeon]|nr:hypothetical protein [Candidatus Woesearchaeota archaeon]
MSRTKISGSTWIIAGSAIILMSVFIDMERLRVFIVPGAIFVVVGFIKIVLNERRPKHKKHRSASHTTAHTAAHHKTGQHAHNQTPRKSTHATASNKSHTTSPSGNSTSVFRCSSCHVKIHPRFAYCPNCGQKMK